MFTCGTGNFAHMDHDEPPPSSPRGSPKSGSKKKHSHNKNPYATRGLDKFSMVLADLETRREKIMAKAGAQGVEMIRFMYDNSQDWVPIIVRPREGKAAAAAAAAGNNEADQAKKLLPPLQQQVTEKKMKDEGNKRRRMVGWRLRWRDFYCWPMVMVLILVCLVMFGRVFAICCTSICWYAMPAMKERIVVKKETKRRPSDKRLVKNLVVQSHGKKNVQELASPKAHGNGKKG